MVATQRQNDYGVEAISSVMEYDTLPDERLVSLFQETSDKQGYEELYKRYANKSYRKALSYVRSVDDAEDVVQNVWVKVFYNLNKFRADAKFTTWLYRITVNESISHLRKRKTYSLDELTDNEETNFQVEDVFADFLTLLENQSVAAQVLALVSDEVKSLLLLKFAEGYTYDAIAQMTGLSASAIKMKISRAKAHIITELQTKTT